MNVSNCCTACFVSPCKVRISSRCFRLAGTRVALIHNFPIGVQVPPHCIPIHANVTTYDWSRLIATTQFDVSAAAGPAAASGPHLPTVTVWQAVTLAGSLCRHGIGAHIASTRPVAHCTCKS